MLGLTGFSPTTVSWEHVTHAGRRGAKVVTPHFPVLEDAKLIISPILQGRVAAEDWGTILAPSLIFYRRFRRSYNIGVLISFLPALLFVLGLLVFGFLFMPHSSDAIVVVFVPGSIALVLLGAYSMLRLGLSLVLKADREAALVIGSLSLISVLRKLESLREHDASQGHDWPEYGDHPSITKRIANLQNP